MYDRAEKFRASSMQYGWTTRRTLRGNTYNWMFDQEMLGECVVPPTVCLAGSGLRAIQKKWFDLLVYAFKLTLPEPASACWIMNQMRFWEKNAASSSCWYFC